MEIWNQTIEVHVPTLLTTCVGWGTTQLFSYKSYLTLNGRVNMHPALGF